MVEMLYEDMPFPSFGLFLAFLRVRAITLRSLEKLPEIDSLIAATAIRYNIDYFYTFDEDFTHLNNRKMQNTLIIKL